MKLRPQERRVLRELSQRVADISRSPRHRDLIARWTALNALQPGKPLIICDPPIGHWPELVPEDVLITSDPVFQRVEWTLRQRLYRAEQLRDDTPVTSKLGVPWSMTVTDWLPDGHKRPYAAASNQAAGFEPCLLAFADLRKLRCPELIVDREQSQAHFTAVQDAIGDILDVRQGAPFHASKAWGESMIDELAEMRGLAQLYVDLCDNPGFIHEAMDFMMRGHMHLLDQCEQQQVLGLNNGENTIGSCGLAFTDELPGKDFNPARVTTRNLWGYAQAQELSAVSPEMLEEFVLPYQARILRRFGMNAYGCCEANDQKWGIIKRHIPHLRMVSVSPWADHEIAADALQDQYVYVWKPNPTAMIVTFDEAFILTELKRVFEITRPCRVAVSLRDTPTLGAQTGRLARWVALAQEAAGQY